MSINPQKIEFDQKKVEEKLIDYRRVVMEDEQTEIANEMAKILAEHINIFHNTLRSFVSLAISLWQTDKKIQLKEINDETPEVRYMTVKEISVYLKKLLTGLLRSKGQTEDLDHAITEALETYRHTWASR